MTNKERIETIRHKANVSIVLMNTHSKLADIAYDKGDTEHYSYYSDKSAMYRCEADAYNDVIGLFGEKPEETNEISYEIMEMEMRLKHLN